MVASIFRFAASSGRIGQQSAALSFHLSQACDLAAEWARRFETALPYIGTTLTRRPVLGSQVRGMT
jgi:hypothetical protein